LLLAAVGLFALLSHALLKRQHEIGIRLALGADGLRLARLVLGDSARLLVLGLGGGLALSLAGSRLVQNSLYGVSAYDPLAWLVAASLIAAVAALASAWPLRRALAIPPTQALRAE
jgi:putative ABC transport system permease protein